MKNKYVVRVTHYFEFKNKKDAFGFMDDMKKKDNEIQCEMHWTTIDEKELKNEKTKRNSISKSRK